MTTTPISSLLSSVNEAPAGVAPPANRNQMDEDTFLKLLVAQLKYQDPMNPTSGAEFMAQTAQYSMVERLNQMAKQMTESLVSQRQATAGNMIGRNVTGTDLAGSTVRGNVTSVRIEGTGPVLLLDTRTAPGKPPIELKLSGVTEIRDRATS